MSKFYVGQRVRLARPLFQKHAGLTGTIVGLLSVFNDSLCNTLNCRCDWDQKERLMHECREGFCSTDQLEPLTDPGRQVVEWSECLWQPEHLHVNA